MSELEERNNIDVEIAELFHENWMPSFSQADSIGRKKEVDLVLWGEVAYAADEGNKIYLNIKYQATSDYARRENLGGLKQGQTELQPFDYSDLLLSGTLLLPIQYVIDWAVGNKSSKQRLWGKAAKDFTRVYEALDQQDSLMEISLLRTIAAMHMNNQKFIQARAVLHEAMHLETKRADVFNQMGMSFVMEKQHLDSALLYLDSAIVLDPTNHVYFGGRSSAYSALNRHSLAIEDLKKELELAPEFFIAQGNLANSYDVTGRFDEALIELDLAIAKAEAAGNNNFICSMYHCRKANILIKKHERKLPVTGSTVDKRKLITNLGLAKIELDKAEKLQNGPFYYTVLGYYLQVAGKQREAIGAYQIADTIYAIKGEETRRASALNGIATVYYNEGYLEEALKEYNRAIAFDPDNQVIRNNRENLYRKMREQ